MIQKAEKKIIDEFNSFNIKYKDTPLVFTKDNLRISDVIKNFIEFLECKKSENFCCHYQKFHNEIKTQTKISKRIMDSFNLSTISKVIEHIKNNKLSINYVSKATNTHRKIIKQIYEHVDININKYQKSQS